jgi:hypothetical protein
LKTSRERASAHIHRVLLHCPLRRHAGVVQLSSLGLCVGEPDKH